MSEFITGFVMSYIMAGFFVAMMWPMVRDALSSERHTFMRKPGETGLEFLGKSLLVFIFWPAPVGAIGYYWLVSFIIPWLTQPK